MGKLSRVMHPLRDLVASNETSVLARMDKFSMPEPMSGCTLWFGPVDRCGYGRIWIGTRRNGNTRQAHRVAWVLAWGDLPSGMLVLHKCDNPPCVNPRHLYLGTDVENARDRSIRSRFSGSKAGLPFGARPNRSGRFSAVIAYGGKRHSLGSYDTAEEASIVALARRDEVFRTIARDDCDTAAAQHNRLTIAHDVQRLSSGRRR